MSASVTHLNTARPLAEARNTPFLDATGQIAEALLQLTRHGHRVLGISASLGALPCVQLQASPELRALVDADGAAYYHYGVDFEGRRFRHGQFQISGVRCVWVEHVDH